MSVVLQKPWTLERFLAWEEQQELRYEFDGIEPVAMTGGTYAHEVIGATLRTLLSNQLRGKPCRALGPTMKIRVAGRIRYPEAVVNCTPPPLDDTIAPEPVAVFEILSPGSSYTDRIVKLREYQAAASIQHYVILEQDRVAATVHSRQGGAWVTTALIGDEVMSMPKIGIELPLADCYAELGPSFAAASAASPAAAED